MVEIGEGRLRAYLDGELTEAERSDVESWLEGDADARAALEELRERGRLVREALALDPAPVPDMTEMRRRIRARLEAPHATEAGGPGGFRPGLAKAAALVLLLAAGASAAVPGSPIRSWLDSAFADGEGARPAVAATATVADEVGVRVAPADGRLVVVLSATASDDLLEIRLVDTDRGGVFAGMGTRFQSGEGRIEADATSGAVRVEIPRSARVATVRVGGVVYFEKRGERIELPGPEPVLAGDVYRFQARVR